MKVRNMVRGGAVVALSLGLASLGTGMGLTAKKSTTTTAKKSTTTTAQPGLTVGPGGGGGGVDTTFFSSSFIEVTYEIEDHYATSIGTTLCNHMTPYNATADSSCIANVAQSLGTEVDYYGVQGIFPEFSLSYYTSNPADVFYEVD